MPLPPRCGRNRTDFGSISSRTHAASLRVSATSRRAAERMRDHCSASSGGTRVRSLIRRCAISSKEGSSSSAGVCSRTAACGAAGCAAVCSPSHFLHGLQKVPGGPFVVWRIVAQPNRPHALNPTERSSASGTKENPSSPARCACKWPHSPPFENGAPLLRRLWPQESTGQYSLPPSAVKTSLRRVSGPAVAGATATGRANIRTGSGERKPGRACASSFITALSSATTPSKWIALCTITEAAMLRVTDGGAPGGSITTTGQGPSWTTMMRRSNCAAAR